MKQEILHVGTGVGKLGPPPRRSGTPFERTAVCDLADERLAQRRWHLMLAEIEAAHEADRQAALAEDAP